MICTKITAKRGKSHAQFSQRLFSHHIGNPLPAASTATPTAATPATSTLDSAPSAFGTEETWQVSDWTQNPASENKLFIDYTIVMTIYIYILRMIWWFFCALMTKSRCGFLLHCLERPKWGLASASSWWLHTEKPSVKLQGQWWQYRHWGKIKHPPQLITTWLTSSGVTSENLETLAI